jgi:hypothetical protein
VPLVNLNLVAQDSRAAEGDATFGRVGHFGEDAAALAEHPTIVQMDGQTVAQLVRSRLLQTSRRAGNLWAS